MNSAPTNTFSRPLALVFLLFIALAVALWWRAPVNPNFSSGAQLFLNTPDLAPTTTFEVRFDDELTGPENIGSIANPSPLEIQPRLAGKFVWLSRRSGVFTPNEPPKLDATYTVQLRAGLRTVAGQPLHARLYQRFSTPAFGFTVRSGYPSHERTTTNASSRPAFTLQFNADVATNLAPGYMRFVNAAGKSIPAEVGFGEKYPADIQRNGDDESATWADRFPRPAPDPEPEPITERSGRMTAIPAPNILNVSPASPLPAGPGWRLVVEGGLPSADGQFRLAKSASFPIGDVLPFEVWSWTPENRLNSGREVRIEFSKFLSPEILGTNALAWFTVEPPVENLELRQNNWGGYDISLAGRFELGTPYRITVRAGLPAANDFKLSDAVTETVVFEPLAPQVYLPTFAGEQLASGRREFEFLSLNCNEVRLAAKRLPPEQLIHALRGFRSYTRSRWEQPVGRALDYNVVPGITVLETTLSPERKVDAAVRHSLKWADLLGGQKTGAALIQVQQGNPTARPPQGSIAQSVVQVTDLGLLWKKSARETFVWCFSYATGEPVRDVTITLTSDESETLATATTDENGLAQLPAPDKATWVLAEKAGDVHAAEISAGQLSPYGNGLTYDYLGNVEDTADGTLRGLLFTERKAYRPGDAVLVKAILREQRESRPALPTPRTLQLTCLDPEQTECFRTNLTLSELGSLAAAFHLPVAPAGEYRLQLHDTNSSFTVTHDITVADYEPNAFDLKLAAKPAFAAGEPVEVPVTANYFMGKSLSNARLRWAADTEDETFTPEGFGDFTFGADRYLYSNDAPTHGAMTLQGEANFGPTGKLTLTPDVPWNVAFPQPRRVDLNIVVTDANQQTLSAETSFVRHTSEFYLGALQPPRVLPAGEAIPVEVVAVNADGTPHPAPVAVQLTLKKIEYETVRLEGAGRSKSFRNQRVDKIILTINATTLALTNLGTRWAIAAGSAPATFKTQLPGEYILELRAKDSADRPVLTAIQFSASAEGEVAWARRSDTRLELIPDQLTYKAGETARLLVKTPVSGPALVTVERDRVLQHFKVELKGNAPVVEIPLADRDAPNVFVSVMMLRGAEKNPRETKLPDYRYGYCRLAVTSRTTSLDVAVTANHKDYRPGQSVEITVQVNDGFGAAAPGAEVTLYAVDEGVLSLTGYQRPDPQAFFYAPQAMRVNTGISIDQLEPENPDEVRFQNKGFSIGGGGREDIRRNFQACAFWNATLKSDPTGRVTAKFPAPDNLTRFRIIAVAHTAQQQFGSGESGFNINKPLMLEPSLPRFANVGDEITLRALIHNQSKQAGEVNVALGLDAHATHRPGSEPTRRLTLAAGASGYVEFPVHFIEAGPAKWIWRAQFADPADGGEFTDAVESTLAVGYPQPLLRETHLARCDSGTLNLLADVNPQLLEGRGTLRVRVANTRLVELSEGIAHLLHYPYGCAEQTGSSLLPWVLLADFPDVLSPDQPGGLNREHALQLGYARFATMQDASGGLAYWPGGEAMLWASAYGGFILALAENRDLHVPPILLDRVQHYLKKSLSGLENARGDEALNQRCLALLALATGGHPESGYHEVMFRKRDELSAESRALLALAILEADGPGSMAAELLDEPARVKAEPAYGFGCTERATAVRLAALTRLRPQDPEVDKAVAELTRAQKSGRWNTTQGNAWSMFALTEYAAHVESKIYAAQGNLAFNAETTPLTLTATQRIAEVEFTLQPKTTPRLTLTQTGNGRLYTTVTIETRSAATILPRQDRGLSIMRSYGLLGTNGMIHEFKDARVGDTVAIKLTIDAHQATSYVAVDDALPAVFEEVNPAFKSQQTAADALTEDWFSDFHQIRNDRVQFFRDHLPAGRYSITHLARVRAQGIVTAPGAKIEAMYHPEQFGFSGTETVATKADAP